MDQALRISYDRTAMPFHEAARLSVNRQDNNKRGMKSDEARCISCNRKLFSSCMGIFRLSRLAREQTMHFFQNYRMRA